MKAIFRNLFTIISLLILLTAIPFLISNTNQISDDDIVNRAREHIGEYGDECIKFVRNVLSELGISIRSGSYRNAYRDVGALEVSRSEASKGDIIQLSNDSDESTFYEGMHAAIIVSRNSDGSFQVIDSNYGYHDNEKNKWVLDGIVKEHRWDPYSTVEKNKKSNLTPHFYRFWKITESSSIEEKEKKLIDNEYVVSVVMVIDVSDSMTGWWAQGVKIESARAAAMKLLDLLEAENGLEDRCYQVALVKFDTTASLVQSLTSDFGLLRQKVNDLTTLEYTNIGDGLEKAFDELDTANYDRAYVVLLSDGMTNTGLIPDDVIQWLRKRVGMELKGTEQLQASLFGFDYRKRNESDSINTVESTKNAGKLLENTGYKVNVNLNQGIEKALEYLPDDAIFSFFGHGLGGGKGIYFIDEWGYESILSSYDIPENLNLLLTVLSGCETASNLQSDENILKAFIDKGSLVGVGFNQAIYLHAANSWYNSFWHALLVKNKTIFEAAQAGTIRFELERYGIDILYSLLMDYRSVVTYPIEKARELQLSELEEDLEQEERAVLSPMIYTAGFGDPGDLDEDLLKSIANITGGEYFYGGEAFSLANIFIKTQHYGTGAVKAEFEGTIFSGEEINAGGFILEERQSELRITLNWPGSLLELQLYDPEGEIVNQDYPGVKIWRTEPPAYLVMEKPQAGEWTVELFGRDVPEEGSPYYVIVSTGNILLERGVTLEFLLIMAFIILIILIIAPLLFKSRSGKGED